MAPHTQLGKVIVIVYALVGIPLTFLMLQGIGQRLTILSSKVNKFKLCSKRPDLNKYLNMILIILIGTCSCTSIVNQIYSNNSTSIHT